MNAYLGNLHVAPLTRLWATAKDKSSIQFNEPELAEGQGRQGSKTKTPKHKKVSLNYIDQCILPNLYSTDRHTAEKAEIKISKQALLEAMFQTQVWAAPYVKNPFIYVTDNPNDFKGEDGAKLLEYFKRVFFTQHKKYNNAIILAVN